MSDTFLDYGLAEGDADSEPMTLDSALDTALSIESEDEVEAVEETESQDEANLEDPAEDGDQGEPDPVEGDDGADESDDESGDEDTDDEDEDRYEVKINGETFEVNADELVNGYQRQSDYTQKTQALAEEREALAPYVTLAEQIAENPADVIAALAQRYGIKLGDEPDPAEGLDPDDPIEAELIELRRFKAETAKEIDSLRTERSQASEDQRRAEVFSEIEAIKVENSDSDLDPNELLKFAVDHTIGDLRIAYTAMKSSAVPPPEPPSIKKIRAKRQAKVAGGGHRAGVVEGGPDESMTLEDALAAALNSH